MILSRTYYMVTISILYIGMLNASIRILSDAQVTTTSFNFDFGVYAFSAESGLLCIGASQDGTAKNFALAAATRNASVFTPIAPEKAIINNKPGTVNPLYNASFSSLKLVANNLLAVTKQEPSILNAIDPRSNDTERIVRSDPIGDAIGNPAKQILALEGYKVVLYQNNIVIDQTGTEPKTEVEAPTKSNEAGIAAFIAVSNSEGTFDGNGSGIAYGQVQTTVTTKKTDKDIEKVSEHSWVLFDANTGNTHGNKALAISKNTPSLYIRNPLQTIKPIVALHWDDIAQVLYVGLQVQSGVNQTDGARALLVATVTGNKLYFKPIAPDAVFEGNTGIVGSIGANTAVGVHKISSLQTSTHLHYVVVVGGNGDTELTKRTVYALPIVIHPESTDNGTLANSTSLPETIFSTTAPYRFLNRNFTVSAQSAQESVTTQLPAAQVGGETLLPGPITHMVTHKDAVFVSVGNSTTDQQAGVFYSQALFDNVGRIASWTNWQRAVATGPIEGFVFDAPEAHFTYFPNNHDVLRTEWTNENALNITIQKDFPADTGGVQSLYEFPFTTHGFSQQVGQRLALQVITGFAKVELFVVGQDTNGKFGASPAFASSADKAQTIPVQKKLFADGVLADIGPIVTAQIITNAEYGWLIVGGSHGIAVLAHADGTGWSIQKGLSASLQELGDMQFIAISKISNIRKLISLDNSIYVLTDKKFIRLIIDSDAIITNNIGIKILARSSKLVGQQGSFSDIIISGPLAVLATSKGLLRSGNGVDIRTISHADEIQWRTVPLPEAVGSVKSLTSISTSLSTGPVTRLYAISPTGIEKEVFANSRALAGNIYVLNAYVGYQQALVYRFTLDYGDGLVQDTTLQLFPDYFVANTPTFFVNLALYRNYMATDGALFWVTRSRYQTAQPYLSMLPESLRSGQVSVGKDAQVVNTLGIGNYNAIGSIMRSPALGAWIIHGDFGIRIQH